jgi:hypothetical protein
VSGFSRCCAFLLELSFAVRRCSSAFLRLVRILCVIADVLFLLLLHFLVFLICFVASFSWCC